MATGDFYEIEAGDTLAILKNESVIMDGLFDFSTDNFGDVANGSNRLFEWELLQHNNEPKGQEEKETPNKKSEKEKKLGHRRVHTDGGVSYKKINTSRIMDSIQLGIQRSVGGLSANPERDVLMCDFMTVESVTFTADDQTTRNAEFIFKTYAPVAFRHFRDLFGIKPGNFVSSFCAAPLLELPNPGASGSVFYLTQNDEFITKTVQHKEAEFLQKLLPGYYLNLNQNPRTLLPKFFGLYCYKCDSKNVRLVVMNNVLPSSITIHQKYDLKGSTYKRKTSKTQCEEVSPTFKDLDFIDHHPEGLFLDLDVYKSLIKTFQRDCRVLESFQIIDYSLLVGIHNLDQAQREKLQKDGVEQEKTMGNTNEPSGDGIKNCSNSENFLKDARIPCKSTNETCSFFSQTKSLDSNLYRNYSLIGLPARQANGEKLLLFIGIIDILQSYRMKKRLEHVLKSIIHDGNSVSVHNPAFYAQRFQEFMTKTVFKSTPPSPKTNKKKSSSKIKSAEYKSEDKPQTFS